MSEAQIWDEIATHYDDIARVFGTGYPAVRARLARDVSGGRVLEVAAGTGQFTLDLARLADRLVAVDISPAMVGRLRDVLASAGVGDVEVAVGSAYELAVRDQAFDVVFCAGALQIMEAPTRALVEFRRVLRPGGLLIAPTFLHASGGSDVPSGPRVSPSATSAAGGPAAVEGRGGRAPGLTQTLFDLDGLVALVAAAGFDVVDAEEIPGRVPIGYVTARRPDAVALT